MAQALATFADARAKEALVAGIEADVARAEAARIGLARVEAERRAADARATVAVLLDVDPGRLALPDVSPWAPAPLPAGSLEDQALGLRGEVAAAEMERQVLERRLALVRRERVPNPTDLRLPRARRDRRPDHRRRSRRPDPAAGARGPDAGRRDCRDHRAASAPPRARTSWCVAASGWRWPRARRAPAPAQAAPACSPSTPGPGARRPVGAARGDRLAPAHAARGAAVAAEPDRALAGRHRGPPGAGARRGRARTRRGSAVHRRRSGGRP